MASFLYCSSLIWMFKPLAGIILRNKPRLSVPGPLHEMCWQSELCSFRCQDVPAIIVRIWSQGFQHQWEVQVSTKGIFGYPCCIVCLLHHDIFVKIYLFLLHNLDYFLDSLSRAWNVANSLNLFLMELSIPRFIVGTINSFGLKISLVSRSTRTQDSDLSCLLRSYQLPWCVVYEDYIPVSA